MSHDTRAIAHHNARMKIMEVAAELAQRRPLMSLSPLEEVTHIGHRQFRAAFDPADEACRLLAIRLRDALDALPTPALPVPEPQLAASGSVPPLSTVCPKDSLTDEQIRAAVRPLYSSGTAADMGLADDIRTVRAALAAVGAGAAELPAALEAMRKERDEWHDAAVFAGNQDSAYKRMFEEAVRALAAIDEALGVESDGCNDPWTTVSLVKDVMANLPCGAAELPAERGWVDNADGKNKRFPSRAVAVDAAPQQKTDSVHQVGATPQAAAALGHGTDDKCSRGG